MSDSPESLSKKDRIDALLRLGESCWKQMDTRRAYEWKVSFGLWTALSVIAGLLIRGEFRPDWHYRIAYGAMFLAIVFVYVVSWSRGLQIRNAENKRAANHFWGLAAAELGLGSDSAEPFKVTPIPPITSDWSHRSQILFTFLLALIAGAALFAPNRESSNAAAVNQKTCCCIDCCGPKLLPQPASKPK
jgi:hypothetical protein